MCTYVTQIIDYVEYGECYFTLFKQEENKKKMMENIYNNLVKREE